MVWDDLALADLGQDGVSTRARNAAPAAFPSTSGAIALALVGFIGITSYTLIVTITG